MPNWSSNVLSVLGPRKSRIRFRDGMESACKKFYPGSIETVMTFNYAFPMPRELVNTVSPRPLTADEIRKVAKDHNWSDVVLESRLSTALSEDDAKMYAKNKLYFGAENWYDWCILYWGTKWDACSAQYTEGPRSLSYTFDTAWAPPEIVIHRFAFMHPDLRFIVKSRIEGEGGIFKFKGNPTVAEIFHEERMAEFRKRFEAVHELVA